MGVINLPNLVRFVLVDAVSVVWHFVLKVLAPANCAFRCVHHASILALREFEANGLAVDKNSVGSVDLYG